MNIEMQSNVSIDYLFAADAASRYGCPYYGGESVKVEESLKFLKDMYDWKVMVDSGRQMIFAQPSEIYILVIPIVNGVYFYTYAASLQILSTFFRTMKKFDRPLRRENEIGVTMYTKTQKDGIESTILTINTDDRRKIIAELYPNIDIRMLCEDYMKFDDSILILHGLPGTGKTTFVKYLMQEIALTGEKIIPEIGYATGLELFECNEFWSRVVTDNIDLLILDDVSYNMVRKQDADNSFVNNLLAYSDGVLNEKSKVIITTNSENSNFDPALLRPGRCFDLVELRPLTLNEARIIWTDFFNMSPTTFPEHFTGPLVTQAQLMYEHARVFNGIRTKRYMVESTLTSKPKPLAKPAASTPKETQLLGF